MESEKKEKNYGKIKGTTRVADYVNYFIIHLYIINIYYAKQKKGTKIVSSPPNLVTSVNRKTRFR